MDGTGTISSLTWILLVSAFCACQSPLIHSDVVKMPELGQLKGPGVHLYTDLPVAPALLHGELERVHRLLGKRYPFLKRTQPCATIMLTASAAYKKLATSHNVDAKEPHFSCTSSATLVIFGDSLPSSLLGADVIVGEKRKLGLSLYEGVFQQRLEQNAPADRPFTWLEQGNARYFGYIAASSADRPAAQRLLRQELAQEYCEIFLGAKRGRLSQSLTATFNTREKAHGGPIKRRSRQRPVTSTVAALFLNEPFEPLENGLLERCLMAPGGQFEGLREELMTLDERYERYVRDRLIAMTLDAIANESDKIERSLADSLLRLILGEATGLAGSSAAARRRGLADLKARLSQSAPPVRFLDQYKSQLMRLARARNPGKLFDSILAMLKRELKRRRGYYNDGFDRGLRELPKAVEREMDRLRG